MAWGEYKYHNHWSLLNLGNALLCVLAACPSLIFTSWLFEDCFPMPDHASSVCSSRLTSSPVLTVNFLYFCNVCIGFWVVGLIQRSFWLIDPYWTIIPILVAYFYRMHPMSTVSKGLNSSLRPHVVLVLIWMWALRLTHSYFRRENWKFGEREDWRYSKLAHENPRSWWVLSFFAVGLAQQPMLVGITLPLYTVNFVDKPWGALDSLSTVLCLTGIGIAWIADNQLFEFMQQKKGKTKQESSLELLRSGLWKYSRHPNYFGEQLFWWSLVLFSIHLGHWWDGIGATINSIVLAVVTIMTEERMLLGWKRDRAALYRKYQRTTSVWIPLPNTWVKQG